VFQSAYWEAFCKQRISNQSTSTHPNRHLILKQANACLPEPYFCSAAATVPAGLD